MEKKEIEDLITTYNPDIRKFAYKLCKSPEDAEDAIQHTLFTLYSRFDSFKSLARFTTWLFAIVKYECLRLFRKQSREDSLPENLLDPEIYALDRLIDSEIKNRLMNAISKLEPRYQEVILLRDVKGLTGQEVSAQLKISVPAVKSNLHRAREMVRLDLLSDERE